MILSEVIVNEIDGRQLRRTTSLDGNMLHKVGTDEYYSEAYDILSANYDYEEVDEELNVILADDKAKEDDSIIK